MGCSPSKGQFAGIYNHQDKALQFGSDQIESDDLSGDKLAEIKSKAETQIVSSGVGLLQDENAAVQLQGKNPTECGIIKGSVDVVETNVEEELLTKKRSNRKQDRALKNDGCKRRQRERWRKTVCLQSNLDLPQAMLKTHQGAYAYLKINMPKYESLLGILEKATQTHLTLQPMAILLALQYEEINKALDEIASEGEQMLKMHGITSLPEVQNDVMLSQDIPEAEINSSESSPDLLQHMIHHLIKKIRLVADSVKGLGDTSLEETVDYYGSLSQSLSRKLEAKRAAESHLQHVLACVESSALGTLISEDSALHSEDSGISVEIECHNGSVRRCSNLENSGANVQSLYGCPEDKITDHPCLKRDKEDNIDNNIGPEDNHEDEKTKFERGNKDVTDRKMSNKSREVLSQRPLQVSHQNKRSTNNEFEWNYQKERRIPRSKTAEDLYELCQTKQHIHSHLWGAQRSLSSDCLCRRMNEYMVPNGTEGPNIIPINNPKPEWINKYDNTSQFCCHQDGNNGPVNNVATPWTPTFSPLPPGKNAVKRLINTFNQGACDTSNQKAVNEPRRGSKRSFLPVINSYKAGVSTSYDKNTNKYPVCKQIQGRSDDTHVYCFPPPPPEVMMDNSFQRDEGPTRENSAYQNIKSPTQRQKCRVSQSPRASIGTVTSHHRTDLNISEICPNEQDHPEQVHEQSTVDKDEGIDGRLEQSQANILPNNIHPSSGCPVSSQGETSAASIASHLQRGTNRDSDNENGSITASSSKSFYDVRSVFCQEKHSASQSVKTSCRSTLPRPWGEPKVSKCKLQAPYLPQTSQRSIPYKSTLTDHQPLVPSVTEAHNQDDDDTTLSNQRIEYISETDQCLEQEFPVICSVSDSPQTEAKIMDKRD